MDSNLKNNVTKLDFAPLWRRYLAEFIDLNVCYLFTFYISGILYKYWQIDLFSAVIILIYWFLESFLLNGQSIGKKLFKIKIISTNSADIKVYQALLRSLVMTTSLCIWNLGSYYTNSWILEISYMIGLICCTGIYLYPIFHPNKRSMLDIFSKTYLVNQNTKDISSINIKQYTQVSNIVIIVITILLSLGIKPYTKNQIALNIMSSQLKNDLNIEVVLKNENILNSNQNALNAHVRVTPEQNEKLIKNENADLGKIIKNLYQKIYELNGDLTITQYNIIMNGIYWYWGILPLSLHVSSSLNSNAIHFLVCLEDYNKLIEKNNGVISSDFKNINSKACNFLKTAPNAKEYINTEYLKNCENGNADQCFKINKVFFAIDNKNEALKYIEKACKFDNYYCADAVLSSMAMKNYLKALEFAKVVGCTNDSDFVSCYNLACAYCGVNDAKNALDSIKKSLIIAKKVGRVKTLEDIKNDTDLKCIHDNSQLPNMFK